MTPTAADLPDPRIFPEPGDVPAQVADVHALAMQALEAAAPAADRFEQALSQCLQQVLDDGDGEALASIFRLSPGVPVTRHLARALARLAQRPRNLDAPLAVALFAIPIVLVAATSSRDVAAIRIPGVLHDVNAVRARLREHRAIGGNETFALANALAAADALDLRRLPSLLAIREMREEHGPLEVLPADIDVVADERAHLRFLLGSAVGAPGAELFAHARMPWAMPVARALIAQLTRRDVSIVALPRAPADLVTAVSQGRQAQRDVGAQLFASNALRSLRAEAGEPSAVISAHRAADALNGGELRLSLSSPLAPRAAQGFRCALLPTERVVDVATMLLDLMHDCRVVDVRIVPGIHADRDAVTGGPLLFKPETLPVRAVH